MFVANLLAWPVGFFAASKWLHGFAYRTGISLMPFVLAAVLTLSLTLLMVSYQSIRAAKPNPADALRYG
ncbi:MAG: hypothetical protein PVF22_03820 [Candidatus Aminicenantes bacterium]